MGRRLSPWLPVDPQPLDERTFAVFTQAELEAIHAADLASARSLSHRGVRPKRFPERDDTIRSAFAAGSSLNELALRFGVSRDRISQILRAA